jgi:hypothetical protein
VGVTKWEVVPYTLRCPNAPKQLKMHNVHTVVTPYTASCLVLAILFQTVIVTAPRKSARLTPGMQCDTNGVLLYNLHKLSPVLCSSLACLHSISYRTCPKSFTAETKPPYFSYINSDNHSLPSHLEKLKNLKKSSSFKKLIFICNRLFCYNVRLIKIPSKGLIQN